MTFALTGIISASYAFFKPSKTGLRIGYGLAAATFISGTYLVIATHAALASACLTGVIYLGTVLSALGAARAKLVTKSN